MASEDKIRHILAEEIVEAVQLPSDRSKAVAQRLDGVAQLPVGREAAPVEAIVIRVTKQRLESYNLGTPSDFIIPLGGLLLGIAALAKPVHDWKLEDWWKAGGVGVDGAHLVKMALGKLTPLTDDQSAVIWALYAPGYDEHFVPLAVVSAQAGIGDDTKTTHVLNELKSKDPPVVMERDGQYALNQRTFVRFG
jgi:hypothetical protein